MENNEYGIKCFVPENDREKPVAAPQLLELPGIGQTGWIGWGLS